MGNCLQAPQDRVVRVMKTDGKILEYKSPIKAHQVLSEFPHHSISDKLPVTKHVDPNADMLSGHLYYLLPLPLPSPKPTPKKAKKRVRFSDDVKGGDAPVVRIKLVISKQELQAMIRNNEGAFSVDQMMISKVAAESMSMTTSGCDHLVDSLQS